MTSDDGLVVCMYMALAMNNYRWTCIIIVLLTARRRPSHLPRHVCGLVVVLLWLGHIFNSVQFSASDSR